MTHSYKTATGAKKFSVSKFKYDEKLEKFFIKLSNSTRPSIVSPIVPKVLYFLLFYLFGGQRSFVPLFFRQIGVDPKILGFILLFPPFISFIFSPIWSGIADTHNAHKKVFFSMIVGTGFCFFLLNFITNKFIVTFIVFLNAVFWAPIIPLADSTTYKILGEPYKELYGKQRLYGSVGFSVSAFFTGLLMSQFDTVNVAWVNYPIAATVLLIFTLFFFNNKPIANVYLSLNNGTNTDEEQENSNLTTAAATTTTNNDQSDNTDGSNSDNEVELEEGYSSSTISFNTPSSILLSPNMGNDEYEEELLDQDNKDFLNDNTSIDMKIKKEEIKIAIPEIQEKIPFIKGVGILVSNSKILIVLFNSVIIACGMSVCNNYLALAITDKKYFDGPYVLVGIGSILNVTFEVIFFFFGKQLLNKIGIFRLVCISHVAVIIRVIAYCIILTMRWSAWSIVPVELLHGICFASIWNSGSTIINNNSPPGLSATGQSLFFGIYMGVGTGLGALFGGYLYSDYGAITMFQFVAAIVTFGLIVFLITEFLLNQRLNSKNNIKNNNKNNNKNNSNNKSNNNNDIIKGEDITTDDGEDFSGKTNSSGKSNLNKKEIDINNNLITKNKSLDNIILSKTIELGDGEYNDEQESLKFNRLLKEQLERERERDKEQKLLEEEDATYNQLDALNKDIEIKEISYN
ncbi:hypothetical protein DICPUDRAFT_158776 [Dictyostelium purpureum]|uniref:Major facilitator superfamily associated domain-containing protein n=1 Tax=Dictyostelium purpureum TaxID=5786 RepID=F1A2G4_DICPU|nr:uncharacterized protein DICPUDRAFT_158776 [Dictyostelium purpureum]EGC29625.1 hypothetical protein DICPUDRAFT_158776 [Dictyostelium purpureum]|eukprot:XP_003293858.1 hypothetical protein DICPUDRAFT_158776 [Dictyostelium purpureum]